MTVANKRNDYLRSMELQKERLFFGVPFVGNLQDRAMTELMCNADGEPICDRTNEHLGSSDHMVSAVRKQLLAALRKRRDTGEVPANLDEPSLDRVRAATMLLSPDTNWQNASEAPRTAQPGRPATYEVPLIVE